MEWVTTAMTAALGRRHPQTLKYLDVLRAWHGEGWRPSDAIDDDDDDEA